MRTVEALKAAGFGFRACPDAVGVTEISSDTPFWYYNTNFYESMADVHEHLEPAKMGGDGKFVLLLAGEYADDEVLPYNLLDSERKTLLEGARARYASAKNDAQRAEDDFLDALRTDEAYVF